MFPDAHLVIYHSAFEHGLAAGRVDRSRDLADATADVGWGTGRAACGPRGRTTTDDPAMSGEVPARPRRQQPDQVAARRQHRPQRHAASTAPTVRTTHVYAECGGVWPNLMMGRIEEAMHYWGKLLKHIGEDRIVWGTDCLWFGSPQPVIQAFRCVRDLAGVPGQVRLSGADAGAQGRRSSARTRRGCRPCAASTSSASATTTSSASRA